MCDKHQHAKFETWVTPENSQHLSSKMVQLYPGERIPPHSTGPGREEVLTVIYGSIEVSRQHPNDKAGAETWTKVSSGEAIFIAENTLHEVVNTSTDTPAQYCYVVTKKHPEHVYRN